MKWIAILLLAASCHTTPDPIYGKWYKDKWTNNGFIPVTFDSLMTVEYRRAITSTTYSVNGNTLTIDKTVMFFPKGDYVIDFFNDQVTLTGTTTATLTR